MFRADSVNMPSPARYWLIPDTLRRATAICPDMVAVRSGPIAISPTKLRGEKNFPQNCRKLAYSYCIGLADS
jgi:hypothetical protein